MNENIHWQQYHKQWADRDTIPANPRTIKAILNTFESIKGKKILEVGSGTGRDSIYLAKLGAECVLLDYIDASLQTACTIANKEGISIKTIKADANNIPFESEYFDMVFSQGFLEHFIEPLALLKEQIRVLKKGGFLLIDVPQKYHIYTIIKHILMLMHRWTPGWETEFTVRQMEDLLMRCSLKKVATYGDWSHPSMLFKIAASALRIPIKTPVFNQNIIEIDSKFKKSRLAHYTFQHIGVVGEKI
jgi:ubiquinone/menaquinone biosynthesis C-methylase UbiE